MGRLVDVADNKKSSNDKLKDVGFLGELWQQVRLVFQLLKDREVPIYLKILPFLGILYTLFPIDIIADVVPVLGQLDDLTILLIGAKVFIEMAPQEVVARHLAAMRGEAPNVIEGSATDVEDVTDVAGSVKLIEGEVVAIDSPAAEAEPVKKGRWFRRS